VNTRWWRLISTWRGRSATSSSRRTSRASWRSSSPRCLSGWTESRCRRGPCSVSVGLRQRPFLTHTHTHTHTHTDAHNERTANTLVSHVCEHEGLIQQWTGSCWRMEGAGENRMKWGKRNEERGKMNEERGGRSERLQCFIFLIQLGKLLLDWSVSQVELITVT